MFVPLSFSIVMALGAVFGPSAIPFWTALAAVAGLLQVVVLVVTAVFVRRYLQETKEIRLAAQRQLGAANAQLEAQLRPALVVRTKGSPHGLVLVNVGSGPAIGVALSRAKKGAYGDWRAADVEVLQLIPFVGAGDEQLTGVRTLPVAGLAGVPVLAGQSLQCEYQSLSGRTYWTVVDFDDQSGNAVTDTRFSQEPYVGE